MKNYKTHFIYNAFLVNENDTAKSSLLYIYIWCINILRTFLYFLIACLTPMHSRRMSFSDAHRSWMALLTSRLMSIALETFRRFSPRRVHCTLAAQGTNAQNGMRTMQFGYMKNFRRNCKIKDFQKRRWNAFARTKADTSDLTGAVTIAANIQCEFFVHSYCRISADV